MSKKKNDGEFDEEDDRAEPSKSDVPVDQTAEQKLYYQPAKWSGVLNTFRCEACEYCNESEDDMILHVVKHVPESERESLLDHLLKKKEA